MRKFLKYPVVLFLAAYILYAIGHFVFRSDEVKKTSTPATTEVQSSSSQPGRFTGRDLDHLWSSFDWNTTTPGKLLSSVIGTDAVNWILWPITLLAVIILIRWILHTFSKTGGGSSSSNGIQWLVLILAVLGLTALAGYQFAKNPLPGLVDVPFPTFDKMDIGRSVVTGGYESTYKVSYPAVPRQFANTGKRWDVCIKVTRPRALPVVPIYERAPSGYQVQDIRFSDRTKTALMQYGKLVQEVEMTFEYVLAVPGQNPCEVIMAKMAE